MSETVYKFTGGKNNKGKPYKPYRSYPYFRMSKILLWLLVVVAPLVILFAFLGETIVDIISDGFDRAWSNNPIGVIFGIITLVIILPTLVVCAINTMRAATDKVVNYTGNDNLKAVLGADYDEKITSYYGNDDVCFIMTDRRVFFAEKIIGGKRWRIINRPLDDILEFGAISSWANFIRDNGGMIGITMRFRDLESLCLTFPSIDKKTKEYNSAAKRAVQTMDAYLNGDMEEFTYFLNRIGEDYGNPKEINVDVIAECMVPIE